MHPWIILFDLDGTLLTVNSTFNRQLLRKILTDLDIYYPDLEKDAFSGRTDHDIFTSFMIHHDFDEQLYKRLKETYLKSIGRELNSHNVQKHVFVDETIDFFSGDGFIKGLMTGNYPSAADIKLKAAQIELEYKVAAFGETETNRNRLPFIALEQAEKFLDFKAVPERFVVIGDTPRDVECAKSAGMKSVAVATGKFSSEELAEHQPDLIIPNLAHPHEWFAKLTKL